jgi:photosystem II stability/assembly factor-like uncharacterized protein
MKKIILIFFLLIVHCTLKIENCFCQSGWFSVPSGTTNEIKSIFFINNQTGWVCGNSGLIEKTTNSGYSWTQQTTPTVNALYTLFFINENTGWAGGGYFDIYNGINTIIKTTNGGTNWFTQFNIYLIDNITRTIFFLDSINGFAGSYGGNGGEITGSIARTTNGGTNWIGILNSAPSTKIIFQNNTTGWSLSHFWTDVPLMDTGILYKTTNGGINWIETYIKHLYTFTDISFFNASIGILQCYSDSFANVNNNSRYLKTTNSGINWFTIYYGNDKRSNSYFLNEYTGWSCGNNITKTSNGGYNWFSQASYQLNMVIFRDSLNGYAVGGGGTILKTTTGGVMFVNKISKNIPENFSLYQNYPNPFNPTTKIKFEISSEVKREMSNVRLLILDITGREIETLVNEQLNPGTYEVTFDGSNLPSGLYFYKLVAGNFIATKKLILLK